jgi:hypothetical protein
VRADAARELVLEELQIGIHHELDEVFERIRAVNPMVPTPV